MSQTPFEAFRRWARGGGMVPVVRHLAADMLTPVTAYAAIARPPFGFLLETLVGGERWARYTFLGTEPSEAWRYRNGVAERWTARGGWAVAGPVAEPLTRIAQQVRGVDGVRIPGLPRLAGGVVGYLAYDLVRTLERLPDGPADDLALPDAVLMVADTLVVIDNAVARAIVIANTRIPGDATARYGSRNTCPWSVTRTYSTSSAESRGRLRPGLDSVHALQAAFRLGPSRARPKCARWRIMDNLEPTRRDPYAGAVGSFGWGTMTMDAATTIRTAILRDGRAHVQAEAGIVADSDPHRELAETESKARAVLRALALAESS